MISHKYRCIFIHIPKTAGTSIEQKLKAFDELAPGVQDHSTLREIQPLFPRHFRLLLMKQPDLARRELLMDLLGLRRRRSRRVSRRVYRDYFKFTVVRNPWARVYSWYGNCMRDPHHGVPQCEFRDFVSRHLDLWELNSQTFWITDLDGNIPMDRIVRFESLGEELPAIFTELGIADTALPHLLDGSGDGGRGPDLGDIYDPESIAAVAAKYAEEIDLLGYSFPPSAPVR